MRMGGWIHRETHRSWKALFAGKKQDRDALHVTLPSFSISASAESIPPTKNEPKPYDVVHSSAYTIRHLPTRHDRSPNDSNISRLTLSGEL